MKKHLVVNFIVVFVVVLTGCTAEMRNNLNELSSHKVSQAVDENKDDFLADASKELVKAEVIVTEIENEIQKKSTQLSEESRKNLDELKNERAKLERQIGILKNVSGENWDMTRDSFSESLEEFKTEFYDFVEELKIG